jgi:hypothetical protein
MTQQELDGTYVGVPDSSRWTAKAWRLSRSRDRRHYLGFGTIAGKVEVSAPNPLFTGLGAASIRKLTRHSPVSD